MTDSLASEREAAEAFLLHDHNGKGTLSKSEMIQALSSLGLGVVSDDPILLGIKPEGRVTCSEFLVFFRICQARKEQMKQRSLTRKTKKGRRRASGIRSAMKSLGVVSNNFFTKKAKKN